jgi:hypothetical protein
MCLSCRTWPDWLIRHYDRQDIAAKAGAWFVDTTQVFLGNWLVSDGFTLEVFSDKDFNAIMEPV